MLYKARYLTRAPLRSLLITACIYFCSVSSFYSGIIIPAFHQFLIKRLIAWIRSLSRFQSTTVVHRVTSPRDTRWSYVLGSDLLDALETALRTFHVLVAGEAEGEYGRSMSINGWNDEFLWTERRSRGVSCLLNDIIINNTKFWKDGFFMQRRVCISLFFQSRRKFIRVAIRLSPFNANLTNRQFHLLYFAIPLSFSISPKKEPLSNNVLSEVALSEHNSFVLSSLVK